MLKDDRFRMKCVPEVGSEAVRLHMILLALSLALAFLIWPTGVFANDSVAAMGAGGIELLKSDHIRMLEEVLEIAPHNVRVKYRFLNESDQDINTKVAFPLPPDYRVSRYFVAVGDPRTILGSFKVLVDGKPVATSHERKAVRGNRDITEELRKSGLSEREIFFDSVFEKLEAEEANSLDRKLEGLVEKFGDLWSVSETVYWDMTFPKGKETVVEHEYTPATGSGWAGPYSREDLEAGKINLRSSFTGKSDRGKGDDCLDTKTRSAVENRMKKIASAKEPGSVIVSYEEVEYILRTGRNWKGPIGEFTLRLAKDEPDQFVSLCFPGKPAKISPTVYQFHQKDFVPEDDLVVYFYTVAPTPESWLPPSERRNPH